MSHHAWSDFGKIKEYGDSLVKETQMVWDFCFYISVPRDSENPSSEPTEPILHLLLCVRFPSVLSRVEQRESNQPDESHEMRNGGLGSILDNSQMDSVEKTTNRSEQKSSRKFLKSLIRKQPQELLLVIGTGVSAAVAPGIPALCSWRSCIEAVIEAAEQLEVLHPGDVAEFRRKVTKDRDLLVVAHDLIRKMSPEVLQNLYRTKSFLFVGCGETLRDQIFQALFLYSVPNKVDLEHYMLVLKENEDHFFKHQADMLLHGIKVVSYGDCFDHFPGYVQDLATQICKQQSPGWGRQVDSTGCQKTARSLGVLICDCVMKDICTRIHGVPLLMGEEAHDSDSHASDRGHHTMLPLPAGSFSESSHQAWEVEMLIAWTAPHYWVMHARTVQRGS
eukprot:XP_011528556.1 protein FAM118A isoform X2 [Homo sapiens]